MLFRSWNGVPGQEKFADVLVYTSTSTLVGNNRGTRVDTGNGSTTVGNCITGSAPDFPFSNDGVYAIRNTTVPAANNTFSLGDGSRRWTEVFAINGVINTSDANEKQQVRSINDQERAVAQKLKGKMVAFKWNHAVEAKGDDARIHFGVLAQEVFAAFESEGLDASRYGIFCKDAWYKTENDQIVHLSEGEQAPDDPAPDVVGFECVNRRHRSTLPRAQKTLGPEDENQHQEQVGQDRRERADHEVAHRVKDARRRQQRSVGRRHMHRLLARIVQRWVRGKRREEHQRQQVDRQQRVLRQVAAPEIGRAHV